jgi:hypothetical protein
MTRPALMPSDTPDYMEEAWISCMLHAATEPRLVAQFQKDTGTSLTVPQILLDVMTTRGTGANAAFADKFIAWANVHLWGPIDGEPS